MKKTVFGVSLALAVALTAAGCSTSGTGASSSSASASADGISVVASTNVWGSVAEAIGGDAITVTSLIDSSSQDPHEFQASARDQLALSDATIVIENGGGYDDFVDTMLDAAGDSSSRTVINAVDLSGLATEAEAAGEELNEHVWYNFTVVDQVAKQIADDLSAADAANASTYEANYESFSGQLGDLTSSAEAIKADHDGEGVAITEPVPLYLLEAPGLVNKTPEEFSEAVEEGNDVSASVLKDVEDLFGSGQVALLAYNAQTESTQTSAVKDAADAAGVPVVDFTETLPDGVTSYIEWMTTNIDNIQKALS